VEFAYNGTRALGIEHTPLVNFGFSIEEPPDLLFGMRPSIPVSHNASGRLRLLHEVHALVRSVLQLHEGEMQARSEPSTAPHFVRGDKVTIVTKNILLRGHFYMKLRDRELGPFTFEEHSIGKHNYILKLPATMRLNPMFHVNNLRPCSTASLGHVVPVTCLGDYEEFDVSHISDVCI
jgi:hypothetical protein